MISFQQTGSLLATLGFLPANVQPDDNDYKLFEELWQIIDGEAREGISTENLKYVLSVLRGFRDSKLEVDCEPVQGKQGIAKIIIYDQEGNLQLR